MTNPTRAYLLIAGRLYMAADFHPTEPGNLYPCSLGELTGNLPVGMGALMIHHGAEIQLFGRRYEVNDLRQDKGREFVEDEIDLELVLLTADDETGRFVCPECGAIDDSPSDCEVCGWSVDD